MEALSLTEEFYGINLPYFHSEVEGCPGYPLALDVEQICIKTTIDLDAFDKLFSANFGKDFDNMDVYRALLLLAIVIIDKDVDLVKSVMDEELRDNASVLFEESIRPQMLKLYIFSHSKEFLDNPQQKILLSVGKTQSCSINNTDAWFTARMVGEYLKRFIPEITSVEAAKEELSYYEKVIKGKKGRGYNDYRANVIMLGTTHLFRHFHVFYQKLPDTLCFFISDFLLYTGIFTQSKRDNFYPENIRSQVSYMESRKSPVKFPLLPGPEVVTEKDKERLLTRR